MKPRCGAGTARQRLVGRAGIAGSRGLRLVAVPRPASGWLWAGMAHGKEPQDDRAAQAVWPLMRRIVPGSCGPSAGTSPPRGDHVRVTLPSLDARRNADGHRQQRAPRSRRTPEPARPPSDQGARSPGAARPDGSDERIVLNGAALEMHVVPDDATGTDDRGVPRCNAMMVPSRTEV